MSLLKYALKKSSFYMHFTEKKRREKINVGGFLVSIALMIVWL